MVCACVRVRACVGVCVALYYMCRPMHACMHVCIHRDICMHVPIAITGK